MYLLVFIVVFSIIIYDSTAQLKDAEELGYSSKQKETVDSS